MDNVTHSLAGMLVAEAACTLRREPARRELRAAAYLLSGLANNLPDIDVVYSWMMGPKPLGSLLHHRGHTHTLLFALPAAWLLCWAALRTQSWRSKAFSEPETKLLFGLALAGPLLHLLMDFGNNYGVHPFWPVTGRWFYGDTIFIVEPLWWAITIPILAHSLEQRWLKLLLWVLLSVLLVVCWFVPFVLPASRFALLGLSATGVLVAWRGSAQTRVGFAGLGALAVALVFAVGSLRAKAQVLRATEAAFPALAVADIAATPMPANPACWEALVVGEQGGRYRVLRASVALPPLATGRCLAGSDVSPTASVTLLDRPDREGVRWLTEYSAPVAELSALRRQDCRFRALLRFARLPYIHGSSGLTSLPVARQSAGDLRYDRRPDSDFSDMELGPAAKPAECPSWVPGWSEPRAELFAP